MDDEEVSVLVVGGGLVGLSAAAFLRGHGITTMVVERHPGTSVLPRGRVMNSRSMELYRACGLEAVIRAAPPSVFERYPELARVETLAGREVYRVRREAPGSVAHLSPCEPAFVDQQVLEPLVLEHGRKLGADIRFSTRMREFEQDPDGVTALIESTGTGRRHRVRARYLIGADGHRSPVRQALGIATHGPGVLHHVANIVFEADLTALLRGRRISVCYIDRPEAGTLLAMFERQDRWLLMVPYHPEHGEHLDDFTPERCLELVRTATGDPTLDARIVPTLDGASRPVQGWELAARVADRFRDGRVFLAGDAAHVVSPAGGFGANTGVQDAHNLVWKLAAVLNGWAGPDLLDSYEPERQPVAETTCAFSAAKQHERSRADGAGGGYSPLALTFGYHYRSTAVIGGPPAGSDPCEPSELAGLAGTRAPHVRLRREGTDLSTLDLFGDRFVLLAGRDGTPWAEAGTRAAARLAAPFAAHRIGTDLTDPDGDWGARYHLGHAGAALVRPDGFVAWRSVDHGGRGGAALEAELAQVLGRLLARTGP
ncbi:FAD-dependent monooxygenase [Kitasatospora sp. NPDC097691]|uniref:FAD-dependent monooxygenase n=1 Tax=Kitasatospora sp. NPDC097691 TaxID=3157231 RepID=UPI00332FB6BC